MCPFSCALRRPSATKTFNGTQPSSKFYFLLFFYFSLYRAQIRVQQIRVFNTRRGPNPGKRMVAPPGRLFSAHAPEALACFAPLLTDTFNPAINTSSRTNRPQTPSFPRPLLHSGTGTYLKVINTHHIALRRYASPNGCSRSAPKSFRWVESRYPRLQSDRSKCARFSFLGISNTPHHHQIRAVRQGGHHHV